MSGMRILCLEILPAAVRSMQYPLGRCPIGHWASSDAPPQRGLEAKTPTFLPTLRYEYSCLLEALFLFLPLPPFLWLMRPLSLSLSDSVSNPNTSPTEGLPLCLEVMPEALAAPVVVALRAQFLLELPGIMPLTSVRVRRPTMRPMEEDQESEDKKILYSD